MHLRTVSRFTLIMVVTLVLGFGCSFPYRPKLNWFTRPTSTLTLTATPSITPSATPTSTLTPTSTFTATLSPTPTSTDTLTPTATKVLTATKTLSPTPAPTYPSSTPTKPIYGVPGKAQLISPSGLIPLKKPVYTWSVVSDATVYYLLVYPVDEPSIYLIDTWYLSGQVCTGSTCSIRPDVRHGYGTYNWLVQTWNAAGFGAWSDAKQYKVSPATPTRTPLPSRTPTPTATAVPTLVFLGSLNVGGNTQSIAVRGNYAYMGKGNDLIVLDISNPATPIIFGGPLNLLFPVEDITIPASGGYAYVAAEQAGLQVIDISNPAAPSVAGFDSSVRAFGVAVDEPVPVAYMAQYSDGFRLLDITNPLLPSVLTSCSMTAANKVAILGAYAYIANGNDGLAVVNIPTPTPMVGPPGPYPTPAKIGQYNSPGVAKDVAVDGVYAFLADGTQGLRVVRVSTPTLPTSYGSLIFSGDAQAISLQLYLGNMYAYVAAGTSGVWIFNVTNPASPVALKYYDTPGNANDVAVVGNIVYVADGTGGLLILQFP